MTKHDLNKYRHLLEEKKLIEAQLQACYNAIGSPNGRTDGSHGSTLGDPTARAAMEAIKLKDKLENKCMEIMIKANEIETWLDSIEDPEIRNIVRLRYFQSMSWAAVSHELYGADATPEKPQVLLARFLTD